MCVVITAAHRRRPIAADACTFLRNNESELVEAWRSPDDEGLLWMRGRTTTYRVDPGGEYVIGIASRRGYHLQRGRTGHLVRAGQLVVLDPSLAHSGSPAEGGPWVAHVLVIELAVPDADHPFRRLAFPEPVIDDPNMARRFLSLHHHATPPTSTLERDTVLQAFLSDLAALSPAAPPRTSPAARDDPAVRRALDYLHSSVTANVSLDELAVAAGSNKYQLVRQFKAAFGVPPHAYQIALRVNLARRLLERGGRPVDVATLTGFADQSHLHRHFRRRLGLTPAQYASAAAPTRRPDRTCR